MKQTDRPSNDQPCAEGGCGHPFGTHYVTHAGEDGCAGLSNDSYGVRSTCTCTGFVVRFTYPQREPAP